MRSLVQEVNRDGTSIGVGSDDCATPIVRKARDSDRSPATGNGPGCGSEFPVCAPLVGTNRPALRAGDHDRPRSVSSKVTGSDAVGAAKISQGKRQAGHEMEASAAITEQDGYGVVSGTTDVVLIRDDDEIGRKSRLHVVDGWPLYASRIRLLLRHEARIGSFCRITVR